MRLCVCACVRLSVNPFFTFTNANEFWLNCSPCLSFFRRHLLVHWLGVSQFSHCTWLFPTVFVVLYIKMWILQINNNYQVHITLMTWRRSLSQRARSGSDGHRNAVNSIAPEPPNEFEPKLVRIFSEVGPRTAEVFKVNRSKIKVTRTFSGGETQIDSGPLTSI